MKSRKININSGADFTCQLVFYRRLVVWQSIMKKVVACQNEDLGVVVSDLYVFKNIFSTFKNLQVNLSCVTLLVVLIKDNFLRIQQKKKLLILEDYCFEPEELLCFPCARLRIPTLHSSPCIILQLTLCFV